jgi:uncharacterized membrane protein YbhN (UPF0104 family)
VTSRRREALVRWGLLALVVVGFAFAVGDLWGEVRASIRALPPGTMVAAWLVATIGLVGPWFAWHTVVSELGDPVPRPPSAEIFFVGQLGKYVPGAVWPVVVQMRLAQAVGVSKTRIGVSFVITLVIGVSTGLLFGVLTIPFLVRDSTAWLAYLLLVPVAAAALVPSVLGWTGRLVLRLTRRPPVPITPTRRTVLLATCGTCFFWVIGGLHLWLLVWQLGGDPATSLPVSLGVLALGVSLGPLFVVLPAGAGVREAVLVAGLSAVLPVADAVAAALLSRAVLVAGDGTLALVALLLARRSPRGGR